MLTLVLGGARSGKSDFAQRLAQASGRDVLFVATMEPGDDETRARILAHRAVRPPSWRTIEAPRDVVPSMLSDAESGGCVLLDCVTLWVSNLLIDRLGDGESASLQDAECATAGVATAVSSLIDWANNFDGELLAVSNEVGLGVVPAYPLGRVYRDALGAANRAIAASAGRVYWLTAGLALELKSLGALPVEAFGPTQDG